LASISQVFERRSEWKMAELHVIGQLVSGTGFRAGSCLFCKFNVECGAGWKVLGGAESGQTQSAWATRCLGLEKGQWFWSHPVDVHFATKGVQGWPKIVCQVSSTTKFVKLCQIVDFYQILWKKIQSNFVEDILSYIVENILSSFVEDILSKFVKETLSKFVKESVRKKNCQIVEFCQANIVAQILSGFVKQAVKYFQANNVQQTVKFCQANSVQ
jgi:hypothetical protein